MEKLLIPIAFIVLMSVLGFLTQKLKKAADRRQAEKERERARERTKDRRDPIRTASSDIDRYLKAVDAQRQKAAPAPRPKQTKPPVVPTVAPARRQRVSETTAPAFPEAKKKAATPKVPTATALDDLPVAAVVGAATSPVVTAPAQLVKPQRASVAPTTTSTVAPTEFGRQFAALLKGPDSLALAVALQEVLGPPKCKRGREG